MRMATLKKYSLNLPEPIKNSAGENIYTMLDQDIIKKIALWAGGPDRYFILREKASLANWMNESVIKDLRVDYYISEKKEKDLWRYPLALGVVLASLYLGALGWVEKIRTKVMRKNNF